MRFRQWRSFRFFPALIILPLLLAAQTPDDLAAASHKAKEAMEAGRYEEAAAIYRELVRALPGNPGMEMNLALALHQAGHYRDAIPQFQAVLKQQPQLMPAWLLLGLAYRKSGQAEFAIAPLAKVVRAEPANRTALLELADAYLAAHRPAEALPHFRALTELDPAYPTAWQGLGLTYSALSQQMFHALEGAAPDSPYRLLLLARSTALRGQNRSAMRLYREAIGKSASLRFAHAGLAEVYRNTGHAEWAPAEEARERSLPAPDCAAAKLECDFLAGRYEQLLRAARTVGTAESFYWQSEAYSKLSQQAFDRLASLPPSSAIHELLAEAARLRRDYPGAVRELREAVKLAPDDRRLQKALARALWLNRDYEAARPLLEELLKLEPQSADLNLEFGDTILAENPEKAIPYLEKALRLSPEAAAGAHAALGRAYMRLDRAAEAIPHLRAALSLDEDGKMYYQLAQAYTKVGRRALAREATAQYRTRSAAARAGRPGLEEDERTPE